MLQCYLNMRRSKTVRVLIIIMPVNSETLHVSLQTVLINVGVFSALYMKQEGTWAPKGIIVTPYIEPQCSIHDEILSETCDM